MTARDLDGRVAIVTGAAMGIGRACAMRMAQQGARVVLADIDEAAGERTRGEIADAGGEAAFLRTDVTSMADMEAAAAFALQRFGTIDILVNNAAQAIGGVVDEIDEATWNARAHEWLPSEAVRAFVRSLMKPCYKEGEFASWIAPPPKGINGMPADFPYVRL